MRRLLVGLFLDAIDVPIVRKWYFPSQRKAMLVVVGDQDGADFEQLKVVLGLMKELGTPYTLYVTPADQPMTKEQFKVLAKGGMDFALHPDFVSPGRKFTEQEFAAQAKKAAAGRRLPMIGERTHGCRWESFRQMPSWAEKAGLQYDAILGLQVVGVEAAKDGFWLGTGLPYRFIDPAGPKRLDFLEIPVIGDDNQLLEDAEVHVAYNPALRRRSLLGLALRRTRALKRRNGSWIGRWTAITRSAASVGIQFTWRPRRSISHLRHGHALPKVRRLREESRRGPDRHKCLERLLASPAESRDRTRRLESRIRNYSIQDSGEVKVTL